MCVCVFSPSNLTCLSFLTLIAGYNNLEVAEYLLEHGADVNAQDKGGLIPLHNAASYGVSMLKLKSRIFLLQFPFITTLNICNK